MSISRGIVDIATAWLNQDVDPDTKAELKSVLDGGDTAALGELFSGRLQFGTAGIRGVLGAGPMRMNRVMIRQVSAGLADYVAAEVKGALERGIVVAYDGRRKSRIFAEDAAGIFLAHGFKVYLGTDVMPTPVAAFAVTDRNAAAGVMVTASHNPPEYNGYKVYWENGAQIIPPHDTGISARIDEAAKVEQTDLADLDAARADGRLVELGADLDERYQSAISGLSLHADASATEISIVYTPLHGVGARSVEAALSRAGFSNVHSVASQREPDGEFPTVRFPNPEEEGAMDAALALAAEVNADLVIANDPDADRLAIALPEDGGYRMLSGDQIGALIADYLLSEGPQDKRLVATTIVSSSLLEKMATANGVDYRETLTGFKWIANTAIVHKAEHDSRFVMGYEEALGYTVGEIVRDKDGVSAAMIFAEMTAWAKSRGETILQRLDAVYRRYGVFLTVQKSLVLPGAEGMTKISGLMERLRAESPDTIAGRRVLARHDLLAGALDLPKSNVLVFRLENDGRVIMRPSGTEPKLKSYYEVREPVADGEPVTAAIERAQVALAKLRDAHQAMLD
jgi:phosphomannomutase